MMIIMDTGTDMIREKKSTTIHMVVKDMTTLTEAKRKK
jgi:hypothetical protein